MANAAASSFSVVSDAGIHFWDQYNFIGCLSNQGYHPLEELKVCKRIRETKLSSAEIARTTVEANSSALLVFPRTVHSKPYEQISWAEFQYVVDDYGEYLISIEALVVFIYILVCLIYYCFGILNTEISVSLFPFPFLCFCFLLPFLFILSSHFSWFIIAFISLLK
ncbi:uncharacterized protein LOC111307777 isoform X3 [Durio zibethinus]|uniref:Uncharacterized protein LOC111307777 isoform X3 n=1 Tax=Durio zibethinus TaxID=66656 RepID=A0A6P6A9X4_DURZI|nr:uncharacterized protein LOC111307777 isoform X3 [Durio zibethinus]